jgi:hypothetical protein
MVSIPGFLRRCMLSIFPYPTCAGINISTNPQATRIGDPVKSMVTMKIRDGQRFYLKQVNPVLRAKTPALHSLNRYAGRRMISTLSERDPSRCLQ